MNASYRVCWSKDGSSVECSTQCYGIFGSDHITLNKILEGYKTTLEPCSSLLPQFVDMIKAERNAQKRFRRLIICNQIKVV
jgi:hypothetical protein